MYYKYKRSELLKLCKKNQIKGVSKKKKKDIIILLEKNNIKDNDEKEYEEKEMKIEDNFKMEEIEEKVLDKKDPISLIPFEEWTEEEKRGGLLINGYYYKEESIRDYIRINKEKNDIVDPINKSLKIPENIVKKYRVEDEDILKEEDIKIDYETRYIQFDYHIFLMTIMYMKIPRMKKYKIETKLRCTNGRYLIGVIPNNISICSWNDYPYEIKALDTASTSEALIIRVSELYKKKRLIKVEGNKINIMKIESLPTRSLYWFTLDRDYYYLDTSPKENNRKTVYNSLLDELDSF